MFLYSIKADFSKCRSDSYFVKCRAGMFIFFVRSEILNCRSGVFLFFVRIEILNCREGVFLFFGKERYFKFLLGSVTIFCEVRYFKLPIGSAFFLRVGVFQNADKQCSYFLPYFFKKQ